MTTLLMVGASAGLAALLILIAALVVIGLLCWSDSGDVEGPTAAATPVVVTEFIPPGCPRCGHPHHHALRATKE